MTPTRLRECLTALHWSQRGLADVLTYSEGTRAWLGEGRHAKSPRRWPYGWRSLPPCMKRARCRPGGDRGETRSDAAA